MKGGSKTRSSWALAVPLLIVPILLTISGCEPPPPPTEETASTATPDTSNGGGAPKCSKDPGAVDENPACMHKSGLEYCALTVDSPEYEAIETSCDGKDNDCDGIVDQLLPVAENACTTDGTGACGKGFATCVGGERVCLTPGPTAESRDGIDNDCNGQVDDVTAVTRALRLRVSMPGFIRDEIPWMGPFADDILTQAGIPHDIDSAQYDFEESFYELDKYSVVYLPGYVIGVPFGPKEVEQLQQFVEDGGVLVLTRLVFAELGVGGPGDYIAGLAGVTTATQRLDATRLALSEDPPAMLYLDTDEERNLTLTTDLDKLALETYVYDIDPESGAQSWGEAFAGDTPLGAAMIRRPIGKGAVYVFGFDPLDYIQTRCYISCFDPGRDLIVMLLRGLFREGGQGHYVVKHTVPGPQSGVLALTHDVDAPDAFNAGEWGEPGAVQMATMEKSLGVRGSYNITTDYVNGYYRAGLLGELCDLGMCPDGGHSIQHLDMTQLPLGTDSVTEATYDPAAPTLFGEILVNLQLMRESLPAGWPIRSWRTPLLSIQPPMVGILYDQGIVYDSSLAIGDFRSNFPILLEKYPFLDQFVEPAPVYSFPITIEDGLGEYVDGNLQRVELQDITLAKFLSLWKYTMLQNTRNGAWTTLLVHPSFGRGEVGPENTTLKVDATRMIIEYALEHDVLPEQLTPLGDFWRGRDHVQVTASYDSDKGYAGTIEVGPITAPSFSLELGDELDSFECKGGGAVNITGRRVVFQEALKPGTKCDFTALPKK